MIKNEFMNRAIQLSLEKMRQNAGGPFGAVIVRGQKIISEGWNQVTSKNDPTAHAEVEAIRSACKLLKNFNLQGCEIYTSCEPCPMCLAAIYWARMDKIYFACSREDAASIQFDDSHIYREISKSISDRKIPTQQFMHDEGYKVFAEWSKKTDRVPY
jgi:tRNA(Arg) A34 adenosine deaminase TadA